jgi:hypothetical protein
MTGVGLLFAGMLTQVVGVLAYKRQPPRLPMPIRSPSCYRRPTLPAGCTWATC